jgi:phosphatidate cytidylyltransferase
MRFCSPGTTISSAVAFFYMLVLVNDAMALRGRLLGKRKIWPVLSPNKTYGGSVGGLL